MVNEFHFALGIEKGACYRGLISLPVAWVSPKTHHCSCGEQKVMYRLARRIRGKVDWGSEGNSSHCAEAAQYRIEGTTETQNVALPFFSQLAREVQN